ncbi:MAG TPA: type I-U CRISPR-associated protein Csb2 [Rhodospirillales bacterium]|nr:type I-U CRISPR-associated protein Csb2 [Rhodospirillales bacterium]
MPAAPAAAGAAAGRGRAAVPALAAHCRCRVDTTVRDAAAGRLAAAGVAPALVERYVIGRGANGADKDRRVRIIPLPSVGHAHADPSIRRILVERPPDCPIPVRAVDLALSNLDLARYDTETGELLSPALPVLAPAEDIGMLGHYGIGGDRMARVWHSVTPVALPVARRRGRVGGALRAENEAKTAHAVRQALRHAGVTTPVESIRVQREPLFGRGARAETFVSTERFPAERLWHVEVGFVAPVAGPLVIGDGRYCGLGVMAKSLREAHRDILILPIGDGSRPAVGHHDGVVAALRRALMSRAADDDGRIPTLFSGHESGPGPARSGQHRHVYLFADDADSDRFLDRLIVVAPWRVDRNLSPGSKDRARFEQVVTDLRIVRAGAAGILTLDPAREPPADDPMFSPSPTWDSRTPYCLTRHPSRSADPQTAAILDLAAECVRRGLPRPHVEIKQLHIGPRGGIRAEARLGFAVSVEGPILLGSDAHRGGGLFVRKH